MPDVSGASAVNTHAHTYYPIARMRLRLHWAPGIPRALFSKGVEISDKARARIAARDRDVMFGDELFVAALPRDVLFES
jgi:hypothetical protein